MPLPRRHPARVGRMSPDMVPYIARVNRRLLLRTEQFLAYLEARGIDRDSRNAAVAFAESEAMSGSDSLRDVMDRLEEYVGINGALPREVLEAS